MTTSPPPPANDDVILRLGLTRSSTLPVVADAVAETAMLNGLSGATRPQLAALVNEALDAVVADSFDSGENIDVSLDVRKVPGSLTIVITQHGAPSSYVDGTLPIRLETLLQLGYAKSLSFVSDGVKGSELRIACASSSTSLMDDEAFVQEEHEAPIPIEQLELRMMTDDDVIGVARLYFRVYGYTKIGSPWIYEPDVFRHMLETKLHMAAIAVTPSGRVVGHSGLLREAPTDTTASGGPIATDPDYRRLGLSDRLAMVVMPAMMEWGLDGMYAEAVTAHPASQKAALSLGLHEVGLILGRQPPELEFIGFDAATGIRRATMVMYGQIAPDSRVRISVPGRYEGIIRRIYEVCELDREVVVEPPREPEDLAPTTAVTTHLTSETRYARITVSDYGADFVKVLQELLLRFEHERFDVVALHMPLQNPHTGYFAGGLGELGLSFNAVLPRQGNGDEIVLGRCFTEQDSDTIAVASDFGEELRAFVLEDRERVLATGQSRQRSRAYVGRILDSL